MWAPRRKGLTLLFSIVAIFLLLGSTFLLFSSNSTVYATPPSTTALPECSGATPVGTDLSTGTNGFTPTHGADAIGTKDTSWTLASAPVTGGGSPVTIPTGPGSAWSVNITAGFGGSSYATLPWVAASGGGTPGRINWISYGNLTISSLPAAPNPNAGFYSNEPTLTVYSPEGLYNYTETFTASSVSAASPGLFQLFGFTADNNVNLTLTGPQPGLPMLWSSGINGFGSWWPGSNIPITNPGLYTLTAVVYNAPSSIPSWNYGSPTALAVYAVFCQEPSVSPVTPIPECTGTTPVGTDLSTGTNGFTSPNGADPIGTRDTSWSLAYAPAGVGVPTLAGSAWSVNITAGFAGSSYATVPHVAASGGGTPGRVNWISYGPFLTIPSGTYAGTYSNEPTLTVFSPGDSMYIYTETFTASSVSAASPGRFHLFGFSADNDVNMTLSGPQPGLPKSWVSGINGFGSWWPGTPAVGLPITVPGTYTLTAYVYNAPSSAGLGWNSGSPTALAVYAAFCQEPKTTSPTGCFYFTINGVQVSQIDCNPKANDIKTDFTQLPGTVCNIQFTVNGVPDGKAVLCPTRANDVEVYWTLTPTGPAITKCTWTYDEKPITGACPVPPRSSASGYANDFVVSSHAVVRVYWTINGNLITPPVTAPKGANDVDFFF